VQNLLAVGRRLYFTADLSASKKHYTHEPSLWYVDVAKKKSKPVALATATGWLDVATAAKLTAAGAPQQITDTSSPNLAQMSALLSGLRSRASEPRRTRAPRPIPAIRRPPSGTTS